ncbi:magnesium transporter [Agrococcus baldri]|uniref:Magnesium transporter n=1 Tax=Agrococcus baldri TaxID=153730 RepID=A0AA94HN84_9MICO|nr:CorA family divalent cation transporter [Agrococcus baldri]SFS14949.1 magnesium transporter [Agrococcus baldri]
MAIADASVWTANGRVAGRVPFNELLESAARHDGFAWIELVDPSEDELLAVARELELHHLLVEDVLQQGQRSKLEPYDGITYCVVHRLERQHDALVPEELHAIIASRCAVTVSWGAPLETLRERLAAGIPSIPRSPTALLYLLLDETADAHAELAEELREQVVEIEAAFFGDADPATVDVYRAMRRVLALERVAEPIAGIVERFAARLPDAAAELRHHLRDVDDHARRTAARAGGMRNLLTGLLQLAAARVTERQNDEMRAMTEQQVVQNDQTKRVTSWAAILFAPTLIAGIYGMNFRTMPELHWLLGYPFALLLMALLAAGLYVAFKRKHWL